MKRLRILAAAVVLLFTLSSTSYAILPAIVAIPQIYFSSSLILHATGVLAAAGLYYIMSPDKKSSVSTNGDITRPSQVTWVDLDMIPAVQEKKVTAHATVTQAQDIVRQNPSKYPKLDEAFNTAPSAKDIGANQASIQVGQKFSYNGKFYQVDSVNNYPTGYVNESGSFSVYQAPVDPSTWSSSTYFNSFYGPAYSPAPSGSFLNQSQGTWHEIPKPPGVPKPWVDAKNAIAANGSNGDISSNYQGELDMMFQDPNYIPVFTDDRTGLPEAPPTKFSTPDQVAAANAAVQAATSASSVASSAASATSSAATSNIQNITNKRSGIVNTINNYMASNPNATASNDSTLAGLLAQKASADSELAAAQGTALQGADSQAAEAAAGALSNANNTYDPNYSESEIPVKKKIGDLLETIYNAAPVVALMSSFSFNASGDCKQSLFRAYDTDYDFDMCPYSAQVQTVGGIILFFAHLSALFIVFSKKSAGGD